MSDVFNRDLQNVLVRVKVDSITYFNLIKILPIQSSTVPEHNKTFYEKLCMVFLVIIDISFCSLIPSVTDGIELANSNINSNGNAAQDLTYNLPISN